MELFDLKTLDSFDVRIRSPFDFTVGFTRDDTGRSAETADTTFPNTFRDPPIPVQ